MSNVRHCAKSNTDVQVVKTRRGVIMPKKARGKGGARYGSGRPKKTADDANAGAEDDLGVIASQASSAASRRRQPCDIGAWRNKLIVRGLRRGHSKETIADLFRISVKSVLRIKRRYDLTGLTAPIRHGSLEQQTTTEARQTFEEEIMRDPVTTNRKLSRLTGVSEATGCRIMRQLGVRSRARQRRQELTDFDKMRRKRRAKKLINLLKSRRAGAIIVSSDECWIDTNSYRNSRLDRVVKPYAGFAGAAGVSQQKAHAPGVMVWGACASDGGSQCIVLDRGTKVDGEVYCQQIVAPHIEWLRQNYAPEQLQGGLWFQDSARPHTAAPTLDFLRQQLGAIGMRLVEPTLWPPKSPDLNIMDYGIWAALRRKVQGHVGVPHVSLLKDLTLRHFDDVCEPAYVRKVCRRLRSRLKKVIEVEGDCFEPKWLLSPA